MAIGATQMQAQWCAMPIDQQMPFGATFGPIGWIGAGCCATKRCRQQFGISRLPSPLDAADLIIESQQPTEYGDENTCLFPFLQTAMQGTAGAVARGSRFPLAAGAQDIQNAVQHSAEGNRGPSIRARRLLRWKEWLDTEPHRLGNFPERRQVSAL